MFSVAIPLTGDAPVGELLGSLCIALFFFPVVSILLPIVGKDGSYGKVERLHIGALSIAFVLGLLNIGFDIAGASWELWGILFYEVLTICAFVLELLSIRSG